MGTKRVAISMVEGLFLFLALEAIGKLSGFLPSNTQEISAGVLLIGIAYSFTVNFSILFPVTLFAICIVGNFKFLGKTDGTKVVDEALIASGTLSFLLAVANGAGMTEMILNSGIASAFIQYVTALVMLVSFSALALPTMKRWAVEPVYQRKE
jgi:hypothetical protein